MNNEIIGDVFFGYNDTETRWVANQEWIYSKVFLGLLKDIYLIDWYLIKYLIFS